MKSAPGVLKILFINTSKNSHIKDIRILKKNITNSFLTTSRKQLFDHFKLFSTTLSQPDNKITYTKKKGNCKLSLCRLFDRSQNILSKNRFNNIKILNTLLTFSLVKILDDSASTWTLVEIYDSAVAFL